MNANSREEICKWHPHEFNAIDNRCLKLYMGKPFRYVF